MSGLDDSLFVSAKVHEKDVTLASGKKHTLWFREISQEDLDAFTYAQEKNRAAARAQIISRSLCNPDGSEALDAKRAAELRPAVANGILSAILEVNDLKGGEDAKKGLPPEATPGSGTS